MIVRRKDLTMSNYETIISGLHAYQGDIFRELTLPVCGSSVSRAFRSSGFNSGKRIVAAALTKIVLKEGDHGTSPQQFPDRNFFLPETR